MTRYYPLSSGSYALSSPFGPRDGGFHAGQDFAADDGTSIYACQAGTVLYIGSAAGYGQWIVLDHSDSEGGGVTEYGHMWDAFATGLRTGDHVEAGQLIAYVGNNGESSGPHCHLSVMPREYSPNAKIDPLAWLAGASNPGPNVPAPTPQPNSTPTDTGAMTFYGIDIASYQSGLDMGLVKAEGFSYVLAKATQGNYYTNPYYYAQRDGAKAAGLLFGSYHYVDDAAAIPQVDRYESVEPDRSIPVMLDHEDSSGDAWTLRAVHDEFVLRGYTVNLIYVPQWYWRDHIGSPDLSGLPPLMASSYVSGSGPASVLYPGNGDYRWNGYGNNTVGVLQFSDAGAVAGQSVDVNAFRGTFWELEALFTGGLNVDEIMSYLRDIKAQLTGSPEIDKYAGWPQLDNKTQIDGLAEALKRLDAIETKLGIK